MFYNRTALRSLIALVLLVFFSSPSLTYSSPLESFLPPTHHIPPPQTERFGTPDANGYMWRDNLNEPMGPVYNWYDISTTGTRINIFGDNSRSFRIPLAIPLTMFDSTFSHFNVNTSGELTLFCDIYGIYILDPFFAHLTVDTTQGDYIKYLNIRTDTVVVSWHAHIYPASAGRTVEFQVLLAQNGTIVYQFRTMAANAAGRIGLYENYGSGAFTVADSASSINYAISGRAIRFYRSIFLIDPPNNAIQVPTTNVTLRWGNDASMNRFDVYLSTNRDSVANLSPSARIATGITDTFYTITTTLPQRSRYHWCIVAHSLANTDSMQSTIFSFLTFGPPMHGTYTIGGSTPVFSSINDALASLNVVGVDSNTTFILANSVYNETSDTIKATAATGPNRRIVFCTANGQPVTINFQSIYGEPGLVLIDAPYVTFDGRGTADSIRAISINCTGGQRAISLRGASDYCTLRNLNIHTDNTINTSAGIIEGLYSGTQSSPNYDTVFNCRIQGGAMGILLAGNVYETTLQRGWLIEGNYLFNFGYRGISLNSYERDISILRNTIRWNIQSIPTYGVLVGNFSHHILVEQNWIYAMCQTNVATGMVVFGTDSTIIANNMIFLSVDTTTNLTGISILSSNLSLWYNTVWINGRSNATANFTSTALDITGSPQSNVDVQNNILSNTVFPIQPTSTNFFAMTCSNLTAGSMVDYNAYSVGPNGDADTRYLAQVETTPFNSISDLRNAPGRNWNAHSVEHLPPFSNPPDLHIDPLLSTLVENAGTPVAVTVDYDNETRSTIHPDIGCDEGNFIASGDGIPPRITHTPLASSDTAGARVCLAYVTDNVGLASLENEPRLYFKRSIDAQWSFTYADSIRNDSAYYFTLPARTTRTVVQYYFAAQDTNRNSVTLPSGGWGHNPPGTIPPPTVFSYIVTMQHAATIGGAGADFATIHDAIVALNTDGAGSGVTFYIRGGTYNEPEDSITASAQTGPDAPVVFCPADTLGVIINKTGNGFNSSGYIFSNCDYVTFDGSHPLAPGRRLITINSPDSSIIYDFYFNNGSDYCCIKNLNINTGRRYSNSGEDYEPIYGNYSSWQTPNTAMTNDSVLNCRINGGYCGMDLYSSNTNAMVSGWMIANNEFVNFGSIGVLVDECDGITIRNNRIWQNTTTPTGYYGVYNDYSTNTIIDGNWISGLDYNSGYSIYGIYDYNYSSTGAISAKIMNNMINLEPILSPYNVYGIYCGQTRSNVFNNTVRIAGTGANYNSFCMFFSSSGAQDSLVNNVLINERTGGTVGNNYHACLGMYTNMFPISFSDNNILSTVDDSPSDNRYVARLYNQSTGMISYCNTLADLRSVPGYGWDTHSLDIPPTFVGAPNLHISTTAPTPVEGNGRPITSVTRDIDGDTRNPTTPDIGCDEGAFITGGDLYRPRITFTPLGTWEVPTPRVLSAIITDNVGVANDTNKPRVYYKRSFDTTWSWHIVDSVRTDSVFYFTIPGYPLGTLIRYYLAAQDTSRNNVTYPFGGTGSNPPGTNPPSNVLSYYVATLLTGVKTVGGTNPNYANLTDAVGALNLIGVANGGVTFRIRSGTYTENVLAIKAMLTANNPATFTIDSGATVAVTINSASSDTGCLKFRCSNVTFDGSWPQDLRGRHLSFASSTVSAIAWFADTSLHNTIQHCVLNTTSQDFNFEHGCVSFYSPPNSPIYKVGNRILDCEIIGGYDGIDQFGSNSWPVSIDSTAIRNCDIHDFYIFGIGLEYSTHIDVSYNHLYNTQTNDNTQYGIYLGSTGVNCLINGNRIGPLSSSFSSVYGIYTYSSGCTFSNNAIGLGGATNYYVYGFNVQTGNSPNKYLFNTISISGATANSYNSYGFLYYPNFGTPADTIYGNIIQNTRTGGTGNNNAHVALYFDGATPPYCDYNLLTVGSDDATDNRYVAAIYTNNNTTRYNTLDDMLSASGLTNDRHSFSELAPFVSDTDLHVRNDIGTPIESGAPRPLAITTDFDGQARTHANADIGADEGDFRAASYGTIQGVVCDSTTGLPPLPNVIVKSGRYADTTDALGRYSMVVRTGNYAVHFSTPCYKKDSLTVEVDSSQVDTLNFNMLHPEISADQTSIDIVSSPGQVHSTTLALYNPGNSDLHWESRSYTNAHSDFAKAWNLSTNTDAIGNGLAITKKSKPLLKKVSQSETDGRPTKPSELPSRPMSLDQTWGPDGGGYEAFDNAEPVWPGFLEYREISDIGSQVIARQQNYESTITLNGFAFNYYGQRVNRVWVTSYGYVQFNTWNTYNEYQSSLPNQYVPNGVFVLNSNDLETDVYSYYDPAENVFYIEWRGFNYYSNMDSVNFELQLHGNNNAMVMEYQRVVGTNLRATIGIQDSTGYSNRYTQCYYNSNTPFPIDLNGYAISFNDMSQPGGIGGWSTWLNTSPISGVIAPHQVQEIAIVTTIADSVTSPAIWTGSIVINSDACPASLRLPITVSIQDAVKDRSALPLAYKLHQNYPNPFNPVTDIRFDLLKPGMTKLIVYDMLGRQVVELVNRQLPAGYHSTRFDASKLASGTYFYRLQSGNFTSVKKMVMVK